MTFPTTTMLTLQKALIESLNTSEDFGDALPSNVSETDTTPLSVDENLGKAVIELLLIDSNGYPLELELTIEKKK